MEIRVKVINGNRWELVNDTWSTYNAWGHKTTIIRDGYDYQTHKVRYYNRTWEMYTYQTCMSGAVQEIYDTELQTYIDDFKYKNNIKRFKRGQKEAVIKQFEADGIGAELLELKDAIRYENFDRK